MRAAAEPASSEPLLTRRAVALILTIAIHFLLLLMLLRLAPHFVPLDKPGIGPITITLDPDSGEQAAKAERTPAPRTTRRSRAAATPPPPPAAPPPPPPSPLPPIEILYLGRAQMAAADIGKMPAAREPAAEAGSAASGDDDAPLGRGPAGQRLYVARWYREPTNQELDFYLPKGRRIEGSAMVACQTVARLHVDNCVALEESPPGSGLSRAALNAAWQFLVRPPRIDGRDMVGEWVRIRIDYTDAGPRPRR